MEVPYLGIEYHSGVAMGSDVRLKTLQEYPLYPQDMVDQVEYLLYYRHDEIHPQFEEYQHL